MSFLHPKVTPIGLDLTATTLRALQLQRRGGAWSVGDAVALQRLHPGKPFDAAEAQRLGEVLGRRAFVGRSVVVALPNTDLIRGLVEVSPAKNTGNAESNHEGNAFMDAAVEIERTHGLEPGAYELSAWLPPTSGHHRQTAVCVNGCRHAASERLLDALTLAGLTVAAIDSRACAVGRVLDDSSKESPGLTAVLDIEPDGTELVLLHNGSVVYQRPLIEAGLDQVLSRLKDCGLDANAAEHSLYHIGLADLEHPWSAKVRKAVRGYVVNLLQESVPAMEYASRLFSELPIRRVVVVGPGAAVPALGIEVQQQLQLSGVGRPTIDVDGLTDPWTWAIALGLTHHPQEAKWAAA